MSDSCKCECPLAPRNIGKLSIIALRVLMPQTEHAKGMCWSLGILNFWVPLVMHFTLANVNPGVKNSFIHGVKVMPACYFNSVLMEEWQLAEKPGVLDSLIAAKPIQCSSREL